ncbi:MAG: ABC transporter permease [Planctomycetaceae bacterium]|nr:ABC transporter permease [Planctomycetaceae bacterium]
MYVILLAGHYLRTKYIALVSIISITLGVATMIVVNSVMSGFSCEMRDRIKGILADVIVETHSKDGTAAEDTLVLMEKVDELVGDKIDAMTPTVEIYGMMSFDVAGHPFHRPVTLVGIVPDSKNRVSPMAENLMTRQAIYKDGKLVLPPLRDPALPLNWDLTPEHLELRKDRAYEMQMREQMSIEFGSTTTVPGPIQPVSNEVDAEAASLDPFLLPASVESTDREESGSSDPFSDSADPFNAGAAAEQQDPAQPLSARVFVGAGLVTYPYRNPQTGEVEIGYLVQPGEDVNITTIKTGVPEPARFKATVADVFKSGMSEYDSTLVFCNLEELQYARGMLTGPDVSHPHDNLDWRNGQITTLQIKLKDYKDADEVVRRLRSELPSAYFAVNTWEQKQGPLLEAVKVESAILNVLLFLIIAVAGFGILGIFYMVVVEKTRDIGILKSLGASSSGVMSVFLTYGLSLGMVGAGAGVVLGLLFVHYINEIEGLLSSVMGHKVFDEEIYYFQKIPTVIDPLTVFLVAVSAIFIAVCASILPAWRAASQHPVKALRFE